MGVDDVVLSEIVRRVLGVARPDRIILFGSAATGQMTKDSDIDLLVVRPPSAGVSFMQPLDPDALLKSRFFARREDSARRPVCGAAQELSH